MASVSDKLALTIATEKAAASAVAETERARDKFPAPTKLVLAWVEEVAEALREYRSDPTGQTPNLPVELDQANAMGLRLRTEGDPDPHRDTLDLMDALGTYVEMVQDGRWNSAVNALTLLSERAVRIKYKIKREESV